MSIESAQAFIERMKTDEEFAKRVIECTDTEARNALVNAEGFDFTPDQVKEASGELSEEELEAVAGGFLLGIGGMAVGVGSRMCW
ncbi:MAG: Nif11-like leader peptide family natural product precursor [Proteobacteria bacterium]|nr:Nif11-like leader peptide family natural product precursor [Pseudomonadota bacterium]